MMAEVPKSQLRKQTRKLSQQDITLLKPWFRSFAYFSQLSLSDPLCFDSIVRLFDYAKIDNQMSLLAQQSCEFLYVLSGEVQITRRKYAVQIDRKKRKARKTIPYENEDLGGFKEGQSLRDVGECTIGRKGEGQAEIVFVKLRARDRVEKEREDRRTAQKAEIIAKSSVFSELNQDMLKQLASKAVYRDYGLNNCIYKMNEPIDCGCFLLLQGTVKVVKQQIAKINPTSPYRSAVKVDMTILSPGQIFGQQQLLSQLSRRLYTVICMTEKVRVLQIPKNSFEEVMQKNIKAGGGEVIRRYEAKRASMRKDLFENSTLVMKRQIPQNTLFPMIQRQEKSPLDARMQGYLDKSMELFPVKRAAKGSSLEKEYRLIKNSHQLLEASGSGRSHVVRSCRSSMETTTDPMAEMTKLYKKINPVLPRLNLLEL